MRFILLILVILISGCTSKSSEPKEILMPVIKYNKINIPNRPILKTDKITSTSSDIEVLSAYGYDVPLLKNYIDRIIILIESNNKLAE